MKLGFLGCGTISSAVVRGLTGQGHSIVVSERSRSVSATLAAECEDVTVADNGQVVAQSDVVFLGVLADIAPAVLRELDFTKGQRVVSFIAGMELAALADLVAPAEATAIMLPFPGISTGGSPILALGETALLVDLFEPREQIFTLKDQCELDAYLSAQAVLSPIALMLAETAQWLGQNGGDQTQGEAFLRALVCNSLSSTSSSALVDALNTPGGFNQRLRRHMDSAGMVGDLTEGLDHLKNG